LNQLIINKKVINMSKEKIKKQPKKTLKEKRKEKRQKKTGNSAL